LRRLLAVDTFVAYANTLSRYGNIGHVSGNTNYVNGKNTDRGDVNGNKDGQASDLRATLNSGTLWKTFAALKQGKYVLDGGCSTGIDFTTVPRSESGSDSTVTVSESSLHDSEISANESPRSFDINTTILLADIFIDLLKALEQLSTIRHPTIGKEIRNTVKHFFDEISDLILDDETPLQFVVKPYGIARDPVDPAESDFGKRRKHSHLHEVQTKPSKAARPLQMITLIPPPQLSRTLRDDQRYKRTALERIRDMLTNDDYFGDMSYHATYNSYSAAYNNDVCGHSSDVYGKGVSYHSSYRSDGVSFLHPGPSSSPEFQPESVPTTMYGIAINTLGFATPNTVNTFGLVTPKLKGQTPNNLFNKVGQGGSGLGDVNDQFGRKSKHFDLKYALIKDMLLSGLDGYRVVSLTALRKYYSREPILREPILPSERQLSDSDLIPEYDPNTNIETDRPLDELMRAKLQEVGLHEPGLWDNVAKFLYPESIMGAQTTQAAKQATRQGIQIEVAHLKLRELFVDPHRNFEQYFGRFQIYFDSPGANLDFSTNSQNSKTGQIQRHAANLSVHDQIQRHAANLSRRALELIRESLYKDSSHNQDTNSSHSHENSFLDSELLPELRILFRLRELRDILIAAKRVVHVSAGSEVVGNEVVGHEVGGHGVVGNEVGGHGVIGKEVVGHEVVAYAVGNANQISSRKQRASVGAVAGTSAGAPPPQKISKKVEMRHKIERWQKLTKLDRGALVALSDMIDEIDPILMDLSLEVSSEVVGADGRSSESRLSESRLSERCKILFRPYVEYFRRHGMPLDLFFGPRLSKVLE